MHLLIQIPFTKHVSSFLLKISRIFLNLPNLHGGRLLSKQVIETVFSTYVVSRPLLANNASKKLKNILMVTF